MTQTMGVYQAEVDRWSLPTLIAYYCRSHTESLGEAKFIFAGVVIEAMKFYWAKNVGQLRQDLKANGLIRGFCPQAGGRNFEQLLTMMRDHLELSHSYTFLDDRNALFHTGLTSVAQTAPGAETWPPLQTELAKLHDQIDDILLTVLQYKGVICSYWDIDTELQFPGRTQTVQT